MRLFELLFRDRSIWFKLSLLSVLPAVVVTSVIAFKVMDSVENAMLKEASKKADALTDLTRLSMSHPFVIYNKNLLDNFVDGLESIPFVEYAMVVDKSDNRILANNYHGLDGELFNGNFETLFKPFGSQADGASRKLYSTAAPIFIDGKQYATLHIGFSFSDVERQMTLVNQRILIVAGLVVFIGVVLALFVTKIISVPIHGLARQAEMVGRGDFNQSLIYESKDAIGQLAESFNRMLADIKFKQRQLKAINTIADIVYRSLDLQTVAQNAVSAMMGYGQYPGVALFMLDENENHLKLFYAEGFDQKTLDKAAVLSVEGSLTGDAVLQRQVITSLDLAGDDRIVSEVRQALSAEKMKTVLSVPLLAHDQVLGAMNLIYKTQYAVSDFEKDTLMSIGKTIGLAMDNARKVDRIQNEIEERKEAERALRESENKYRNLVERANDGIIIIQDGRIQFANPSVIALSGQNVEDFLNQDFTKYLHPTEQDKIKKLYEKRVAGEIPPSIYETIFIRKDGTQIYAEVNAGHTIYNNRPADLIFIRDITERKKAQEALRRAYDNLEIKVAERTAELAVAKERAEESDRLKSAFLAAMSHELRTPLNSIIGFTGIMLQKLVGPLNDEQIKQLTMVKESAHHLLSLINDVLDLSKIEAGQLNVASETVDIKDAVKKVMDTISPMAIQKGLKITADIGENVGSIVSDKRRVEQILLNIVNNAVKFTPKGQVIVTCRADSDRITISVKDTGIGITQEDMQKLFKAFQQVETGLSRPYEGTGLGLSICKKLVELLGGEIKAESEGLGLGAMFTFTLPVGENKG